MHLQPGVGAAGHGVGAASRIVDFDPYQETAMPDITLPEVKRPDIKLPDGLRDMNKRDIQNALGDRLPKKVEMPDVDLSKVDVPKAVDERLKRVEKWVDSIDLSKTAPGKAIDARLNPRRPNPLLPIAALVAVLSAMAAAVWLVTSPTAATRVRDTADRTWRRLTGQTTDLIRRDDDGDLASLLDPTPTTELDATTWPGTASDVDGIVGTPMTDEFEVAEVGRPSGV